MATKQKEIMLTIRVPKELRDNFLMSCHARDQTAAQEIRAFMREYLKQNENKEKQNESNVTVG